MQVSDLERLYDYGYWATERLFGVLSTLTSEEFSRRVAGSYGSIRNTLVHVLSAEWGWLDRCGGPARGPKLNPDDYPTVESLREQWTWVEGQMREFLSRLSDDDLEQQVAFAFGNGPAQSIRRGDLLLHAAVHAVHHRGQVALLLRELGHTPGNFDLLVYAEEMPQSA